MDAALKVAVVGAGYWGKNLVRNYSELGALKYVCDANEEVLVGVRAKYGVQTTTTLENILCDREVPAVVIAAPAAQHYALAKQCLLGGKDVFVEKPLALRVSEGEELARIAVERARVLMVGHLLEYHPAILELKRLIRDGELGKIQYIYSSRLNLGKLRAEEDILWSFAPHDISAILFLLGEDPVRVSSTGGSYLNSKIFDVTLSTCDFQSGAKAHIFVSWLHPYKEQKLTIVGGRKMAVFDDMEPEHKLVLYSHRIEWLDRVPVARKEDGQVVELPNHEPLRRECEHFLECVRDRKTPRTSAASAVRVLRVLEACEQSLRDGHRPIPFNGSAPNYYSHPTAVVDEGCQIGEGTKIWHFSHIMAGAKLGKQCNLGQNVVISPGVTVGNNVKIQNNVSVYTGVELEDDVFCGPSMVFTNVINPRSHIERKSEYKRTLVKRGASIGANATLVCGVTLGRYSFVAAGAVITKDVSDFALMIGMPARQAGWVCYCGTTLPDRVPTPQCPSCSRKYRVRAGFCVELESTSVGTPVVEFRTPPSTISRRISERVRK